MTKKAIKITLALVFVFAVAFTYSMSFEMAMAAEWCNCIGGCNCHPIWEGHFVVTGPHGMGYCDASLCGDCNNPYPDPCW